MLESIWTFSKLCVKTLKECIYAGIYLDFLGIMRKNTERMCIRWNLEGIGHEFDI